MFGVTCAIFRLKNFIVAHLAHKRPVVMQEVDRQTLVELGLADYFRRFDE